MVEAEVSFEDVSEVMPAGVVQVDVLIESVPNQVSQLIW